MARSGKGCENRGPMVIGFDSKLFREVAGERQTKAKTVTGDMRTHPGTVVSDGDQETSGRCVRAVTSTGPGSVSL